MPDVWVADAVESSGYESVAWTGCVPSMGAYVWTDGTDLYWYDMYKKYNNVAGTYKLNRQTREWERTYFTAPDSRYSNPDDFGLEGERIWTDGESIFYNTGRASFSFVLNTTTKQWTLKSWDVGGDNIYGNHVWESGGELFHAFVGKHYKYNKTTKQWENVTFINPPSDLRGGYMWNAYGVTYYNYKDGDTYYSYTFDPVTLTFTPKTWSSFTPQTGFPIWTDGNKYYYTEKNTSTTPYDYEYELDPDTGEWVEHTWDINFMNGNYGNMSAYIWHDGNHTYYSRNDNSKSDNYEILSGTRSISVPYRQKYPNLYEPLNLGDVWVADAEYRQTDAPFAFTGYVPYGNQIWTDGNEYYFEASPGDPDIPFGMYKLNKETLAWERTYFTGPTSRYGSDLKIGKTNTWFDGDNVYSNGGEDEYAWVLDKANRQWVVKSWGVNTHNVYSYNFWRANGVWFHVRPRYPSYKYNKSTGQLEAVTVNNIPPDFDPARVWHDLDDNAYYTNYNSSTREIYNYVFDIDTLTWVEKTWTGFVPIDGASVWDDGRNVYYTSTNYNQGIFGQYKYEYMLDPETGQWVEHPWPYSFRYDIFSYNNPGNNIWRFGNRLVFTMVDPERSLNSQHELIERPVSISEPYRLDYPELFEPEPWPELWLSKGNTPYRLRYPKLYTPVDVDAWFSDGGIPFRPKFPDLHEPIDMGDVWVADAEDNEGYEEKAWNGHAPNGSINVFTDGIDIYWIDVQKTYDGERGTYRLNRATNTWERVYFTCADTRYSNYNDFGKALDPQYIWTDGETAYYTNGLAQWSFALDRSTLVWSAKSWNVGAGNLWGTAMWYSPSGDLYHTGNGNRDYKFNKNTKQWESVTFLNKPKSNLSGPYNIWSAYGHTYYTDSTYSSGRYVSSQSWELDYDTMSWSPKTWIGFEPEYADPIWTDGKHVYYTYKDVSGSRPRDQEYVLNPNTGVWEVHTWDIDFMHGESYAVFAARVWHDGKHTYYSSTNTTKGFNDQYEIFAGLQTVSEPYRLDFPPLYEPLNLDNIWISTGDVPFRADFPPLYEPFRPPSPDWWMQNSGYVPYRPWPGKVSIPNLVQNIEVPDIDWSKSMQQTFEYYTVDPKNWRDVERIETVKSSNCNHDMTSETRGSSTITTTELIPENYIRTYMICRQGGYEKRICLGTYLYMTSQDNYNGVCHNYSMTGYTPLVELKEKLAPIGYFVYGRIRGLENAPNVSAAITSIIENNTRCKLLNGVVIDEPLLNNFVAQPSDNWLRIVNNLLTASEKNKYMITVDEWGKICLRNAPTADAMQPKFIYTDDNSSILLPDLDMSDDLFEIPNVIELIFVGNSAYTAVRAIARNDDEASIVSTVNRKREIWRRYSINNISIPADVEATPEAIEEYVTAQAETLLEKLSTVQKTITYSHGYCDVKVGDCVLINYEKAGFTNVKAIVTSQKIKCEPGCQVDETAVYTKKLWKRGGTNAGQ